MFNLTKLFKSTTSAEAQNNTDYLLRTTFMFLEGDATVEQIIQPGQTGRVRFRGSWWPACCMQDVSLVPGEVVHVVGHHNITLLVEQMHSSKSQYQPLATGVCS